MGGGSGARSDIGWVGQGRGPLNRKKWCTAVDAVGSGAVGEARGPCIGVVVDERLWWHRHDARGKM